MKVINPKLQSLMSKKSSIVKKTIEITLKT